jgi:quinol-cytochrome oxidoreductase complex cytochrome b subunit
MLIMVSAWSGSILPWNPLSRHSLELVSTTIRDFIPGLGDLFYNLYRKSPEGYAGGFHHVYISHILLLRWLGKMFAYEAPRQEFFPVLLMSSIVLISTFAATLWRTDALTATGQYRDNSFIAKPEWYFYSPMYLLRVWPSDLAALLLIGSLIFLTFLPFINKRIRYPRPVMGIAVVIIVFFIITTIAGWLQ